MARLKIDIAGNFLTRLSIPVRITDINYGNHLGNDSFVSILHEARVIWLAQHQFSELNAAGSGLIMRDLSVEFLSESFYGDTLDIEMYAGDIARAGFEILYQITTHRQGSELLIARAKTSMLCFDYHERKLVSIPAALAAIIQQGK